MAEKSWIKDLWNFLWNSDSPLSWIVDLIIAFAVVKWVFFPLLSLIFATSLPMVVVESTSMLHEVNFDSFWSQYGGYYEDLGITKNEFSGFSFRNGFDKGDIMVIRGSKEYKVGDIIVFDSRVQATPIIHRIIKIENGIYSTKGDHNAYQLNYEKEIQKSQIIGKAVGKIPYFGWLKLFFIEMYRAF